MKRTFLLATLLVSFTVIHAQIDIRPYAAVGYGLENQVGFRGITIQGEVAVGITEHMDGVFHMNYFFSNSVPKWDQAMNDGAYFHQVTTAIKALYFSGENGNGLLFSGGLAFRSGKTRHFLTGDLHNGVFSNDRYITDVIRGKGLVGGIGYGFSLSRTLNARVEFNHYAFTSLNDMQTVTLKLGF